MTIEEIKKYLKENKMTYKDLAEKCNVSESTLKNLFSGATKNPRINTMRAIEKALNIAENNKNDNLTEDENNLLQTYRSLSNEKKQLATKIIDCLFRLNKIETKIKSTKKSLIIEKRQTD